MTKTNNQSARGLDDRGQADSPELSVRSCSISRLSHIKGSQVSKRYSALSLDDQDSVSQSRVTALQPNITFPRENV